MEEIQENICKARHAFFHFGSIGVFQGDMGPLSFRKVIESCIMPVLLYGRENWILSDVLVERLEAFQAELVKRVLKWPKHHSNNAVIAVLSAPTMKYRVLVRKLGFLDLMRVMTGDSDRLSGSVVLALCDEVESICLVRECREMEESFGTQITMDFMIKKAILNADNTIRMNKCVFVCVEGGSYDSQGG